MCVYVAGMSLVYHTSDSYFASDSITIYGNTNFVYGAGCDVVGDSNKVHGAGCTVVGDCNLVGGDGCSVTGRDNTVTGDKCVVSGARNIIYGAEAEVTDDTSSGVVLVEQPRSESSDERHEREGRSQQWRSGFRFGSSRTNSSSSASASASAPSDDGGDEQSARESRQSEEQKEQQQTPKTVKETLMAIKSRDITTDNEDEQCVICCVRRKCVAVQPCGHVTTCVECALEHIALRGVGASVCSICRQTVQSVAFARVS